MPARNESEMVTIAHPPHLKALEAERINIMREVEAQADLTVGFCLI